MTSNDAPEPPGERRDRQLRAVGKVTRGVAAAAVLGTVVVGGLAAADASDGPSNEAPATTHEVTASGLARDVIDSLLTRVLGEGDAQAPSSSGRAPVAPSGGS